MRAIIAAIGCAATLALAAPAAAADATPTISAPASRVGSGTITISGTAPAGATVELYESAYLFNDFYPSPNYSTGGNVTTTANSAGHYSMSRLLDSGFRFYVVANGVASARIAVAMTIAPTLTLTASGGTVTAQVSADPAQPGLAVHIQRSTSGTWKNVAGGVTSDPAATYSATLTGQNGGTFRAVIDADKSNNLLAGHSVSKSVGAGPAPTGPVVFSKIVYDSPGKDTGSNTSLNAEYVRLTNKGGATANLKGWTIRDAAGNSYRITADFRIGAGQTGYLHSGKGTDSARHRYWNRTTYVWNNAGDTASLRTGSGKTIDTCKWSSDKDRTYC